MSAAWLMLAVGNHRQHGGNSGYEDAPESYYRWDSTVPNHTRVANGDRIVLWDKETVLGASVISTLERGHETKETFRCTSCRGANIKARRSMTPRFRCYVCKAVFEEPLVEHVEVETFLARYGPHWVDLHGLVDAAAARSMALSPRSQHSIREMDWNQFRQVLTHAGAPAELAGVDRFTTLARGGHSSALVRLRIGQAAFRSRLLQQFGPVCALTGSTPPAALEAAHLYSYADFGRHHDHGGLLLRRDLHRLFDLGQIRIDPAGWKISISSELSRFDGYQRLDGDSLKVTLSRHHRAWLHDHWVLHSSS